MAVVDSVKTAGPRLSMPILKFIISICLLIVIVLFAVENLGSVRINYYDYQFNVHSVQLPLLAVILASLFVGFFSAWAVGFYKQAKLKSELRKQNKTIRQMIEELDKYK